MSKYGNFSSMELPQQISNFCITSSLRKCRRQNLTVFTNHSSHKSQVPAIRTCFWFEDQSLCYFLFKYLVTGIPTNDTKLILHEFIISIVGFNGKTVETLRNLIREFHGVTNLFIKHRTLSLRMVPSFSIPLVYKYLQTVIIGIIFKNVPSLLNDL